MGMKQADGDKMEIETGRETRGETIETVRDVEEHCSAGLLFGNRLQVYHDAALSHQLRCLEAGVGAELAGGRRSIHLAMSIFDT